jgi:metal-dependent hydrolase (beta-lactamase superfamily II)
MEASWGFSCWIAHGGKNILFYTGSDGIVLSRNITKLAFDAAEIDLMMISHQHWDHTGGIYFVLDASRNLRVLIPRSFSAHFKADMKRYGAELMEADGGQEISPGFYTTGDLHGSMQEQAALVKTSAGIVVITGCAHPGIVQMAQTAKNIFPQDDLALVMGGFHLLDSGDGEIREIVARFTSTLKAIQILTCDFGLGMSNRRITVSTCGLAPQIVQLGKDICINLAVSLNAHDDETRSHLMPVNRKYPLATLLDACKKYPMPGRRLLTFEYILIDGINSSRADAEKLARLLKDQRCKLNLIVFNEYPGSPFKSPSPQDVSAFQQILLDRHFTAMLRKSKGSDILAACGQLSGAATTG